MYFSTLVTLFLSATVALSAPSPTLEERQSACSPQGVAGKAAIRGAFKRSGVIPTLIPDLRPKVMVRVRYPAKSVRLGNSFTTAQTTMAPKYSISALKGKNPSTQTFSFFMIDPDVPSPDSPTRATYLHWYTSGNKASCIKGVQPVDVTMYQAPSPGSTAEHRYTFLVYAEPPGYAPDVAGAQTRPGFDVNAYAAAGGLTLVGGNFFLEAITNM